MKLKLILIDCLVLPPAIVLFLIGYAILWAVYGFYSLYKLAKWQ